ncbi:MAG: SulP family inorganic anion transporter [Sandaracinaceae bacterium]|nr:SulP family inorganic anion transporter [Sandaracinaceae bacterium]
MAGVVVFLVALPLCLGIAIACGVPPVSGLIAGIIGGAVVPLISRSHVSVSGPAAGLTSIVLVEVGRIGLGAFLTATALAGVFQVILGALRAGRFSTLVPSAVVKGMLAAIGATIILKQLPVGAGVEALADIPAGFHPGSLLITVVSLVILFGWERTPLARVKWLPSALIVVLLGAVLGVAFEGIPALAMTSAQLVSVPTEGAGALIAALPRPDLAALGASATWVAAVTVAVVASIETLLSIQAVDRIDTLRRKSPPDRELLAQGVANVASGLAGGLPVTAVIVRSGANVAAGGRERWSSIFHAVLLMVAVLALGPLLNRIPLACLAAVLIKVGFGLCNPRLFRAQYRLGIDQLLPFGVTIAAILATDLLEGVIIGIIAGVIFVLRQNARDVVRMEQVDGTWNLTFHRDGTFVAKPAIQSAIDQIGDGDRVRIDCTGEYIDPDVKELLAAFQVEAASRSIVVEVIGVDLTQVSASAH